MMIPIDAFPAETHMEIGEGKTQRTFCTVVGVDKDDDDDFQFVVMVEDEGQRWVALRDHVTARDGRSCWPD